MIWLEPHLISQSIQAFSSAVGRFERLWDNGISLNMFLIFFFFISKKYSKKFSAGDQPQTKSWRNSGLEIGVRDTVSKHHGRHPWRPRDRKMFIARPIFARFTSLAAPTNCPWVSENA